MTDAAPALKKRVRSGTGGKGAIHALWSLEGIGALDKDTHQSALLDKDPALRRNAIRALPANEAGRQLFFSSPVIQDPDLLTRQVAFVKLAEFPTIPEIQTVVAQLPRIAVNTNDAFLNDTLTLLGRIHKVSGVGENEVKVTAGDPKRGEDLFYNSPTAACASCHMVNGKGGDVGPILDGIAVRSDKAYILESLMDPNAKLAKGFESLTISPMPPLGVLLKEQELADILAYLHTLTTPPKDGVTVPVKKANHVSNDHEEAYSLHHWVGRLVGSVAVEGRVRPMRLRPDSEGYIRHWVMLAPIALPEGRPARSQSSRNRSRTRPRFDPRPATRSKSAGRN